MVDHNLLYPVLALIGWTFVMWIWLYATRIPAMQKADVDVEQLSETGGQLVLPPEVSRVADNYNHLHEQPTLFYALVLCAALLGAGELADHDSLQVALAWGYVLMRIAHSLVQATVNRILVRFGLFALGSVILLALFLRTIQLAL